MPVYPTAARSRLSGLKAQSYQAELTEAVGAHNIYVAVLGEIGPLGFAAYLAVLAVGLAALLRAPPGGTDRVVLALMWLTYLMSGLDSHTQITAFTGMIYIGLLLVAPRAVAREVPPGGAEDAPGREY